MLNVLELFAGIGACSSALSRLGIEYNIVDAVEIDKYAVQSFNAVHNTNFEPQDITKWNKDVQVDLIMHGSPCFVSGTKILTDNGYKDIDTINIGDNVLTHNNHFKKVTDIGSDGEKSVFKLETQGTLSIECTSNHPFLVRHKNRVWDNENRKYKISYGEPQKKQLSDLKPNVDFVGVPIICDEENEFHTLDDETLWLLGRYVADGHIDVNTKKGLILSVGNNKINQFDNIKTSHKVYQHTKSCYRVIFDSKSLVYKIVSSGVFGFGALNKKIPMKILQLSKGKLSKFLDGYMSGDGCKIKETSMYQATTISRDLAESLVLAVQKVYSVGCRIYYTVRPKKCIIEDREVNQHNTYMIRFNLNPKVTHYIVDSGCIWYPIKKITDMKVSKVIYNITVEDDHTYTANNCYCFNCQDFSIAGKQAGGDVGSGTRSSLLYETLRIVRKLKPKYVIWENVKNILSGKHMHNFRNYLDEMNNIGYINYYEVLNAKDFGVPQNRERVFTVSIRKDIDQDFRFPKKRELKLRLKDVLETSVDEKYYLSDKMLDYCLGIGQKESKFPRKDRFLQNIDRDNQDVAVTISTNAGNRATDNFIKMKDGEVSQDMYSETTAKCEQVGTLFGGKWDSKWDSSRRVYSDKGISPTIHTCQGGDTELKVAVDNNPQLDYIGTISEKDFAKDGKSLSRNSPQGYRVYDSNGIATTQSASGGGIGGNTGLYLTDTHSNNI